MNLEVCSCRLCLTSTVEGLEGSVGGLLLPLLVPFLLNSRTGVETLLKPLTRPQSKGVLLRRITPIPHLVVDLQIRVALVVTGPVGLHNLPDPIVRRAVGQQTSGVGLDDPIIPGSVCFEETRRHFRSHIDATRSAQLFGD